MTDNFNIPDHMRKVDDESLKNRIENMVFTENAIDLAKKYPNDVELGGKIRQLVREYKLNILGINE